MDSKQREYSDVFFSSSWCSEFSTFRNVRDEKTQIEINNEIDADGDDLTVFVRNFEDTASRCEIEIYKEFCHGVSFEDVRQHNGPAGSRKAMWLDERSNGGDALGSGDSRHHKNPITAVQALKVLRETRFNHQNLPDAARRIIYITDLDPAYIYALVASASCHQAPVLREAVYKHLSFTTSIMVHIPSDGFKIFQLDLHLPFFLLTKSTPPEKSKGKTNTKPPRQWTDMSFLNFDTTQSENQEKNETWIMHEAHISCVVTGSDDWRWVAYCFVDTEIDGFLTDLSKDDLCFDPASRGECEAKNPIWKPRDYWLKIFEIRISQVRKEWEYLIYKVKFGVNQHVSGHK
jgi:hypothetical protein